MLDTCIMPPPSIDDKPDRLLGTGKLESASLSILWSSPLKSPYRENLTIKEVI